MGDARKDKEPVAWVKHFGIITTTLSILGAVVVFFYSGIRDHQLRQDELTWKQGVQQRDENRLKLETNANARETKKAFLDLQMKTYSSTLAIVSQIVAESGANSVHINDFRSKYRGEMALVEDRRVEFAMYLFDYSLSNRRATCPDLCDIEVMLAHCMRVSMAESSESPVEGDGYCIVSNAQRISAAQTVSVDEKTLALFKKIPEATFGSTHK